MARLSDQLTALATMSPAQLRDAWQAAYDAPAPSLSADLLRRGVGYRLQELRYGGLGVAAARALQRRSEDATPKPAQPMALSAGSQLIREWQGRTISVLVTETGFLFEGRAFASLSSIANLVTGAHRSGPRFFGLGRHA
ncbi:DUF2924 domain-containing protein [Sphingomonas nostoxanthinifaciens]|uniref:DUF2924 domain-containing protein n=1 Tax=Sphingomonas nostoxanthinifaciens TaxID=2872652 RepID=UPI001CC1E0D8|nr:DUF2924 domain-containing protein [Sphingomonas nostoxanthinifaciens]UAK23080.1 DUF2924 domain-containing protein [Sphingomonas nostoxanthinifaciens]